MEKVEKIILVLLFFSFLFLGSVVFGQELFEFSHDSRSFEAVWQTNWKAQTFTPSIYHKLSSVKLYLSRTTDTTIGLISVGIRATDNNKPIGEDLCVGTYDGDTISESLPAWHEINLSCELEKDVKYAIVVRCPNSDADALRWRDSYNVDVYANGEEVWSTDSGSSWLIKNYDFDFEEWGRKPFLLAFTTKNLASTTAYIGDVFTSIRSLFFLAGGIHLAFYVIKRLIRIMPM